MSDLILDLDSEIESSFSTENDTEVEVKGSEEKVVEGGESGSKEKSEGAEPEKVGSEVDGEKDENGNPVKKEAESSDKKDKPSRAEKRVAEVLQQRYKDRQEIEALREKLAKFENDGPEPPKEPKPEDFKFDPKDPESVKDAQRKFDHAMGRYHAAKEAFDEKLESSRVQKDAGEKKKIESERAVFIAKIEEGKKLYPDYDEAFSNIADSFPITEALHYTLLDSKDPAGVLRHLGKNPELAEKILNLPTARQAIYLAKIDLNLKYTKDRKVKVASSAPAPAAKVAGSGGAKKDPSKMSAEEYQRFKHSQKKT